MSNLERKEDVSLYFSWCMQNRREGEVMWRGVARANGDGGSVWEQERPT